MSDLTYHAATGDSASAAARCLREDLFDRLNRAIDADDGINEAGLIFANNETPHTLDEPFTIVNHKLAIAVSAVASLYATGMRRFILREDTARVTRILLLINGDHTSAWNARRRLLSAGDIDAREELRFNALILSRHPKSAEAWTYRRFIVASYDKPFAELVRDEIALCARCAESYRRNYYAWRHRLWLIQAMSRDDVISEWTLMREWINSHISDHSGFHHAVAVLSAVIRDDDDAAASQRILSALTELTALQSFYGAHESMWQYRRALIHMHIAHAIKRRRSVDDSAAVDVQAEVDGAVDALRAEFAFIQIVASADDDADGADNTMNRQFAARHRVFVVDAVMRCSYGHTLHGCNDNDITPALMAALSPQHANIYRNALNQAADAAAYNRALINQRMTMLTERT